MLLHGAPWDRFDLNKPTSLNNFLEILRTHKVANYTTRASNLTTKNQKSQPLGASNNATGNKLNIKITRNFWRNILNQEVV